MVLFKCVHACHWGKITRLTKWGVFSLPLARGSVEHRNSHVFLVSYSSIIRKQLQQRRQCMQTLKFSTLRLTTKISYWNKNQFELCIKIACIIQNCGEEEPEDKTIWKTCYYQTQAVNHCTALNITKMANKLDPDLRTSMLSAYIRKLKLLYR